MAGLAILITEHIGTNKLPTVSVRVAKLVAYHQTLLAHLIASEEQGLMSPGGRYKPDTLLYDLGRAHFLQNYRAMMYELLDLGGRTPLCIPSEKHFNTPPLDPWFETQKHSPRGTPLTHT